MRGTGIVVAWCALAIGCSGGDDGSSDAGITFDARAPFDGAIEPAPPAAPEPPRAEPALPALPVFLPCPAGWREVTVGGVTACDPWPTTGRESCGAAEAHFPGEPGCRPVGAACEADGWPGGLPASGVLFVRAGAPAGGDGSRDAPYARIADALAVATSGMVVAIASGTYPEDLVVPDGVTLWGACAAATTLSGAATVDPTVTLNGVTVVVRDLRVTGDKVAFFADSEAHLTLRGVAVEDVEVAGVYTFDSDVVLDDVVIRRVRPGVGGLNGRGLSLSGGSLVATRVVIDATHEIAVFAARMEVSFTDVAVFATQPQVSDGLWGHGLHAQEGATVAIERGFFQDNHRIALLSGGDGGELRLTDVVVRRTRLGNDTSRGIDVEDGSHLVMRRVHVDEQEELGVFVSDATVDGVDAIVSRTTAGAPGLTGRGVGFQGRSAGTLSRVLVDHSLDTGVFIGGLGADVALSDVTVRVVGLSGDGTMSGRGIAYQTGARGTISRLLVEGATETGLLVASLDTAVVASDVCVRAIEGERYARGISAVLGGSLDLSRAEVTEFDELAVFVAGDGALLRAEDVYVRDTTGDGSSEARLGRGVSAQMASRLELTRVWIERVGDSAITCLGPDATCIVADLTVDEVAPNPDGEYGRGIQVQEGSLDLRRASLVRASEVGLTAILAGSIVRASDLVIRDTRSGARGHLGRAVMALDSGRIEIERGLFERNHEIALGAFVAGELVLTDVVVRDTLARPCAADLCEGFGAGVGVGAYLDGRVTLTGFVVESSALAGLQIARDGQIDATDGVIRDNPIGANVQVPGYDLTRISERVRYEGNGRGLDATELFVPPP